MNSIDGNLNEENKTKRWMHCRRVLTMQKAKQETSEKPIYALNQRRKKKQTNKQAKKQTLLLLTQNAKWNKWERIFFWFSFSCVVRVVVVVAVAVIVQINKWKKYEDEEANKKKTTALLFS